MKDPMKEIETDNNVYMFHNVIHDIYLFTNAPNYPEAMDTFDKCWFENEKNGVYFKCGSQPN